MFWRYRRVWFLFGLIVLTALAGAVWVLTQIPLPPEAPQSQTTIIYDASGAQLATLHGQENRFPVRIDEVPAVVQNAIVAAEDRKFFQHGGIDPVGIARATWADIRQKGATQGGSTITQQYVKNVYVGADPTLWRKLREAVISVKLERKLDKHQILERYMNTVYFGRGAYGIQAAARTWFGKDVGALDLKEAAYLAGLIRTPVGGDVVSDPATATSCARSSCRPCSGPGTSPRPRPPRWRPCRWPATSPCAPSSTPPSPCRASAPSTSSSTCDPAAEDLQRGPGPAPGPAGLDQPRSPVQRQAYDAVYGLLDRPTDPAGALVAVDPDGRVVAMVGGKNWEKSKVNLAVGTAGGGSGRQAGSTFKPFALAATVREGYTLESSSTARPRSSCPRRTRAGLGGQQLRGGVLRQHQPDRRHGELGQHRVCPAGRHPGPQKIIGMAKNLGISSPLSPVPSIALGTQDVSVMEMAGAY